MYGRKVLSVYARDLKVGMVTEANGRITEIFRVAPAYYTSFFAQWPDEPYFIGIRYEGKVGYTVTHAHELINLARL
jgi:hypothetical protein